jgi:hypothetical protein
MLDNRYAVLFIRGERPVMDEKYDIMRHPNVGGTTDGHGKPYNHSAENRSTGDMLVLWQKPSDNDAGMKYNYFAHNSCILL